MKGKKLVKRTYQKWLGITAALVVVLALAVSLTGTAFYYSGYVNSFLGLTGGQNIEVSGETNYYPSAYGELNAENSERLLADIRDHNIRAMHEGAVLLRNENNALPLSAEERSVTFFGNSVKDPVYKSNAGNASFNADRGGELYAAFEAAGFEINPVLREAYANSGVNRSSTATRGTSSIGEVPVSFYTDDLKASFADNYNDVAFVLLTRYGGEGVDLDPMDAEGVPMLSLHQEEADLLRMIHDSGAFAKTVVLINSPYAMDVEWIEQEEYGVDACLVFGAVGDYGFIGLTDILTGASDVSGHLPDTWASSSLSAPAMQNFGDYQFTNLEKMYSDRYLVYAEDIYVGYKYYETRYQDQVLGLNNAGSTAGAFASVEGWDYAAEMAYPFGYGLSYAQFTQEVESITWDQDAHTVTAQVKVTNDGGFDGVSKSLVQLYAQAPWEPGQVEKSAVQLIGFQKTGELAAGESETVTITVPDYYFASYDENAVNGADSTKTGCYILDPGEYYFAIGDSSHDALNNILAAKGASGMFDEKGNTVPGDSSKAVKAELAAYDNTTWAVHPSTGTVVSNQLQDADLNEHLPDAVTYLTRADWNTFPVSITGLTATDAMAEGMVGATYVKPADAPDTGDMTFGEDAGLKLVGMKDVPYGDDEWQAFIEQLSINQVATICGDNRGNVAIPEVGKPANASTNGPCGIQGSYVKGSGKACTLYVDEPIQAATFNLELAAERGALMAEEAMYADVTMVFGPGANIHRTAYLGRNSEYFSEDGMLSYFMSRDTARTMTEKGIITGFKHFCLNDQEVNRHGVATFSTEQTCREIYFRAFEGAMSDDNALGVMTSYNRIGLTASPAHRGAQIEILRNEWGFKGINITDSSKDASDYVLTAECITGGTDLFLSDTGRTSQLTNLAIKERDGNILSWMQTANKHFYYAHSRSILVNGLSTETVIEQTIYWWQPTLIGICIGVGVLTAASLAVFFGKAYLRKECK
ncbi:glycoside hydrolase family 3 protein [uncultured Pseudoflavonifractor sp.]|uniref:glycoside hydrolase family 3 protein n=1 Tax=uncultured Pseudoflavonifractor sp. TaxID=1221379 RepID=UPI0025D255BF|nr:glycoside hydrolase family 3 protein [uncultured Pseudoflavonifractor sp.]